MSGKSIRKTACGAAAAAMLGIGGAVAQPGLPANLEATLARAAAADAADSRGRTRNEAMIAAVIAAIAAEPRRADAIVARGAALSPADPQGVVDAAAAAFPGLVGRSSATTASAAATVPGAPAWSGEVSVGGSRNTGNTETNDLSAGVALGMQSARWTHEIGATYEFASDRGARTENRLEVEGSTRYDFAERSFLRGRVFFEDDEFSGFDWRVTENVALGYRLFESETVTFTVEAGPGARHSKVETTGVVETDFVGVGQSEFRWRLSDSATLVNVTRVTAGRETTSTRSTTALDLEVIENVVGRLSFEVRHDSNPPPGAKSTDTTTKLSAVYGF